MIYCIMTFQTGLREFYSRHDEVMEQIRCKYIECIRELANLEDELNLQEQQHFRKRSQENNNPPTV